MPFILVILGEFLAILALVIGPPLGMEECSHGFSFSMLSGI